MRITAGLAFIVTAVTSVMALKEAPADLQIGKTSPHVFFFHIFITHILQVFLNVFLPSNVWFDPTMGKKKKRERDLKK